ncbi:MAG TPA: polyphosphate kinase 2 family protein [Planctomycetota bacterium]|nr:polyphosphate kinase 2 family protein [Planctomycetota bacterium]
MGTSAYRIDDGKGFKLKNFDPNDTGDFKSREHADEAVAKDLKKLQELQEKFYVDRRHALLVVIQAMDTGGKDGTIDHVFSGVNPTGCLVTSFKKPSETELAHDYLWRVHAAAPARGMFGIFNRSHYEDVLVARVHNLVPKLTWEKRYDHINHFEKTLADEGTLIVKFFLHISKDEQKERLQARLDDKEKLWKFNTGDLTDRELWNEFQEAYEDVIRKCSTPHAPWYIVPANKKWYRNYVVAHVLVKVLEWIDYKLPKPDFVPSEIVIK